MTARAGSRDALTHSAFGCLAMWAWFLYGFGPMLPLLRAEQGTSRTMMGLHSLLMSGGAVVAGLATVPIVRRVRRRGAVQLGVALVVVGVVLLCAAVTPLVTLPAVLIAAVAAPLFFLGGALAAVLGAICWGIAIGMETSVMNAGVAHLVPEQTRARAFGIFSAVFGISWFAGSSILGALYDVSFTALVAVSVAAELAALLPLIAVLKAVKAP